MALQSQEIDFSEVLRQVAHEKDIDLDHSVASLTQKRAIFIGGMDFHIAPLSPSDISLRKPLVFVRLICHQQSPARSQDTLDFLQDRLFSNRS